MQMCYRLYDKISDTVYFINKDCVLKFVVLLNKKDTKSNLTSFHREILCDKDNNSRKGINIDRNFYYYLNIESIKYTNSMFKDNITIDIKNIFLFKNILNIASEWFKTRFVKDKNNLISTTSGNDISTVIYETTFEMFPSVQRINEEQIIGVRMVFKDVDTFLSVDEFMTFKYVIDTFNMYQSAQNMLNYIGRPDYGYNLIDLTKKNNSFLN